MASWPDRLIEYLNGDGRTALAEYLGRQRWFGAKGKRIVSVHLHDYAALSEAPRPTLLALVSVQYNEGPAERYALFLVMTPARDPDPASRADSLFTLSDSTGPVRVMDATADADACLSLVLGIRDRLQWPGHRGAFRCLATSRAESALAVPLRQAKRLGGEQSNTSIVFNRHVILKLVRKCDPGMNPDREVLEFLTTRTRYQSVPPLIGLIEYQGCTDSPATVGLLQTFIPNDGDGWSGAVEQVRTLLRQTGSPNVQRADVAAMRRLGAITAELHVALSSDRTDPAFRPEPISQQDIVHWHSSMAAHIERVFTQLKALDRHRQAALRLTNDELVSLESSCKDRLDGLRSLRDDAVTKIRVHGDYHLGQVLKTGEDFIILDFEGEPARPLEERRAKQCALKDVAGMLRSFNYAACAARREGFGETHHAEKITSRWEQLATDAFWGGYTAMARPGEVSFLPATETAAATVLRVFELDKAIYEIGYELNNRPDWLEIPLGGLRRILDRRV